MSTDENLTYIQRVAIKGEVALALSTSSHDAEIKYKSYILLRAFKEIRPFVLECLKESVSFDHSILDKIYIQVLNNEVPVWIWIDEVIADIKLHLNMADIGSSLVGISDSKLSINKLQERKNILESAFTMLGREAFSISPAASEQLFDKILNDYDLEFLHKACFCLKTYCTEARGTEKEIPEDIMMCTLDLRRILDFNIETESLKSMNKMEESGNMVPIGFSPRELQKNVEFSGSFEINNIPNQEELSNLISEKIAEFFQKQSSEEVYIVKKIFKNSGISTDIRICKSKEEALNFIDKIIKEYPELTKTCKFKIHTERNYNNGNNQNYHKRS